MAVNFVGNDAAAPADNPSPAGLTPGAPRPHEPTSVPPSPAERAVALVEVALCSDYPTQLLLGALFAAFHFGPTATGGTLTIGYVMALSFGDTLLLLGIIHLLMRARGDRWRDMLFGGRPLGPEFRLGVPLVVVALAVAFTVLILVQHFAPSLHTVARNPLQELIRTPRDAWLFAVVVVVAGGLREEVQRAFLLGRFERWLGGGAIGVVVTSVAFGAGHLLQGFDAALATGTMGALWGVVYLRRRSVVAPMVSHSGFNLFEIVQFLLLGR
jgi:membrane protease YdiL (CAAX protease family)